VITLLDTAHDFATAEKELGSPVGQLLTPLTRYRLREPKRPWAIDNGAYARFKKDAFWALIQREEHRKKKCLFVAVPDVVGSARRTLEVFDRVAPKLKGWKLALVAQDGQEDLPIPWEAIDAVFIGGTTDWKLSKAASGVVRAAKILGKWVHAGRVNTPQRFAHFADLGVDSIDGTGLSRYTHMRQAVKKHVAVAGKARRATGLLGLLNTSEEQ
jgi:hypothetical protein